MDPNGVKEALLGLEDCGADFSVVFSGKASKKVNGLYKPYSREIVLHNRNFENDNQLMYTAVHEYAHHIQCTAAGGELSPRHHTAEFWACFHGLLKKAEEAGLYTIGTEASPELAALTEEIREKCLRENGRIMRDLGKLLEKAHRLCAESGVRYEDYVDRVLCLPRTTARAAVRVASLELDASMGYEAMKVVAAQTSPEKREKAVRLISQGESPDTVRASLSAAAAAAKEKSPKERLEQEKERLEKNIARLTARLEHVEQSLASLS
ncbi:MAG: hypothetical protein IAA96_06090 [Spirochaetes bacterium]|uniref:Uncharacterized protein n=1 Tax=Candidatus Avitreponema avistercoris TaxID=2840705 RepID=A0A9D9HGZ3_9SPIR|nr:hypothetical protein [Candidatus Avitreponema avistercoris]